MINWQPIETAPKDGTEILMTNGEYTAVAEWYTPWQGDQSAYWLGFPYVTKPTHWAPINLPGEEAACETCGKQQTCPWTTTNNRHCDGWSKCV